MFSLTIAVGLYPRNVCLLSAAIFVIRSVEELVGRANRLRHLHDFRRVLLDVSLFLSFFLRSYDAVTSPAIATRTRRMVLRPIPLVELPPIPNLSDTRWDMGLAPEYLSELEH